jgi:hypothetical protein
MLSKVAAKFMFCCAEARINNKQVEVQIGGNAWRGRKKAKQKVISDSKLIKQPKVYNSQGSINELTTYTPHNSNRLPTLDSMI